MSKFIKRILKTSGVKSANVIFVGSSPDHLNDLVAGMKTVFYVGADLTPRVKNIIHIKDIGFLNDLSDIQIVFINQGFDDNVLQFLAPLTRRCTPVIFLNQEYPINKDYYDLFKRIRYEQITILEPYQIWKVIRK